MSAVIEKLLKEKPSETDGACVVYFYFKYKKANKDTYNSLLRAILEQLFAQDPSMSDHLYEEVLSIKGVNFRSTKTLEKFVKSAIESYAISYIILDGLDECAVDEAPKSVNWLLSLADGALKDTTAKLRVIFSGQRDGVLDKLLVTHPSINLETSGHVEDIRRYCLDFCKRISSKFGLQPSIEKEIALRVTEESQGTLYKKFW